MRQDMNPIRAFFLSKEKLLEYVIKEDNSIERCRLGIVLGCSEFKIMYQRLDFAYNLYKQGFFEKFLLIGGKGFFSIHRNISEAEAMKNRLLEIYQVEEDKILIEDRSRNTVENAINTVSYLTENDKKVILITSRFHLKRASKIFLRIYKRQICAVASEHEKNASEIQLRKEAFLLSTLKK